MLIGSYYANEGVTVPLIRTNRAGAGECASARVTVFVVQNGVLYRICKLWTVSTKTQGHKMTEPTLEDFIERLRDPNPDVRLFAAWTLGRHRDPRMIEPLIEALADEDATVRVRVAESLGNMRDP